MTYTFCSAERLKSRKTIQSLFRGGQSFSCYPLRLVYTLQTLEMPISEKSGGPENLEKPKSPEPEFPIRFTVSVPKKNFKRAVVRNLLRRRVRESYRLSKNKIYKTFSDNALQANTQYAFMVLYVAKEVLPYSEIERGVHKMWQKFLAERKRAQQKSL
jgi:ribonuclease P protein component